MALVADTSPLYPLKCAGRPASARQFAKCNGRESWTLNKVRLADAIDALPRELAVWHDGPTALAKLLTHCTLNRLADEAKLFQSGITPGLLHPDTEMEHPAYTEHRDRWSHAVSTIVDWHGRLCHTQSSLVPVPAPPRNSSRSAAKRHRRLRPRRVSERDYQDAVALASAWFELDPIRVGIRTGDMEVVRSAGRHIWVENLRRADVEVLDIVLGLVTVRGRDGVDEHDGPDSITNWFASHSLAEPGSRGLPVRHPSAFGLLNSLPSHLRSQAWTETEIGLCQQGSTVTDELDLGGLTFGEARTCYAFLISQLHLNWLGAFHFGAPEAMLWAIRPSNLEFGLAQRVGHSAAHAFIEMCTFSTGRSPLSAPLIPDGELVFVPAEIVSPIAYERTLLRAASANPERAGRLGNILGSRASRWAERLRTVPGCQVAEELRVTDAGGRTLGDLDVVAWDPDERILAIFETKWPVDAATLSESYKVDAMFDKGITQVVRLRSAIDAGSATVRWSESWNVPDGVTTSWWVGSAQQLDSRVQRTASDIQTTSLRLVEQLLPAQSLGDLLTRIATVPLPRRGEEFDLEPRSVLVGRLTVHYDALALIGEPPVPPPDRRLHMGWT
jgi:hypothetical protein